MKRFLLIASALMLTTAIAPADAEAARRPGSVVSVSPAQVWVPAHRSWSIALGRFVTISGQWKTPPHRNSHWVPGHYAGHGPQRRWVAGHWTRNR